MVHYAALPVTKHEVQHVKRWIKQAATLHSFHLTSAAELEPAAVFLSPDPSLLSANR